MEEPVISCDVSKICYSSNDIFTKIDYFISAICFDICL